MLLSKLREYADQQMEEWLPPLYASTPVAWTIALTVDGRPVTPRPISRVDPSTARGKRGVEMIAPEVQRAAGIKPLLLADNGEYTFGRARDSGKQKRVDQAHQAYLDLLHRCAVATEEPAVLAVQSFYEHGGVDLLDLEDDWDYGLKVTFEVFLEDGSVCRPIDLPTVQAFWLSEHAPDSDSIEQCLVCGEHRPVLDRLQGKVKGVRGGQSSGTSIISANSSAFESYGLKASRIAPTCRECGEAFTRSLNDLLRGEDSHIVVGDATFVFWTQAAVSFNFGSFMREPQAEQVRALVDSFRTGKRMRLDQGEKFYAASLSASGGRAAVRDWIDTTVGNVQDGVARWFQLQRIVDPRDEDPIGEQPRPFSLFQLAASTVRDVNRDLPVTTPRALFRAAVAGTPLPLDLAYQAVRRCRAEQGVTRPRASLIKLVLLGQDSQTRQENYMVALEPEHPSPAYHCGRLLAVLEQVQRAALPNLNATIVDRYYGAASSTPAVVFGSLLRGAQPHLSKLDGARRGALQNRIADTCAQIDGFPKTLSLEQQALFSLGYYHQRADNRAQALSRRAAPSDGHSEPDANLNTEENER